MSINDFFNEAKFKRFHQYTDDKNLEYLYQYLESETAIEKMVDSIKQDKPALMGIIKEIEEEFVPKLKIEKDDSLKKQLIGSMISFILADYGYENNGNSKTLGKHTFFSVAACYKKVKYNPFNKNKELKTLYKLGTSDDFLFVDEFDDYIGNDESKLTFKKLIQLLLSENNINTIIESIEDNVAPIDYAYDLISKHWPKLHEQGSSSGYIFSLSRGQVALELILEHILLSKNYVKKGYTTSEYFPKTLKYCKDDDAEKSLSKRVINISDDCCYICKQKISDNETYLKLCMFINEGLLKHENVRFSYPKICKTCCNGIKHFKELFKNINIDQIKKDSNFLFDLPENVMKSDGDIEDFYDILELQKQTAEYEKQTAELQKQTAEYEKQTAELQKQIADLKKQIADLEPNNEKEEYND